MSDPRIQTLLQDLRQANPDLHALVLQLREKVYNLAPGASEQVKYGGLLFSHPEGKDEAFCGIFAYTNHCSVEFGRGAELPNPHQQLQGKGKHRRHIKLNSLDDIQASHLTETLQAAWALAKQ
ncbi:MAG: DUF1801 domain-containing protein [Marinospirillum sp.]|uniref:DUF1801 domain-containing protein n=1 Tax=Marinospirillum sp. TaxID=2183934 RepID=UPI0019EC1108|nr:DUF1801 domain-containing protein [Marinospirillum sp.]MBE0508950.1 DUF1801 domain-containing protein [Marinospirillum sp.]